MILEAPLITQEIVYRLLMGEQGDRLHHLAALGGYTAPIVKAIERLHKDFDQPLRIDGIARELGMSVSGFHHHFKAVTAMSPLQYQKRLELTCFAGWWPRAIPSLRTPPQASWCEPG